MKVKVLLLLLALIVCMTIDTHATNKYRNIRIAVISDPHIQDTCYARSMDSQLHSTRLFNENYFAFLGALNSVANKNIKYVILPGDLTDNGQKINIELVNNILKDFHHRYGINFYLMTGNHDPLYPIKEKSTNDDLTLLGYNEIINKLSDFGFFPKKEYHYWATPFSSYNYKSYSYKKTIKESNVSNRFYKYNGYKPNIPDCSYVVEPIKGIWLLGIDASIYKPKSIVNDSIISFEKAKEGFNSLFNTKQHLLTWIQKVAEEAKRNNKLLISFSHFPVADFNDGTSSELSQIAQPGKFENLRIPNKEITELLANSGISFHLSGHMHMNDEVTYHSSTGKELREIHVPTVSGYLPAYKILNISNNTIDSVETVILDSIDNFDYFFKKYTFENDSLNSIKCATSWNRNILSSKNYREFCSWHLNELVRLRYLPSDFLPIAKERFIFLKRDDICRILKIDNTNSMGWNGMDMINDFYKLRVGGKIAKCDIPQNRIHDYEKITSCLSSQFTPSNELESFVFHFLKAFKMQMDDND